MNKIGKISKIKPWKPHWFNKLVLVGPALLAVIGVFAPLLFLGVVPGGQIENSGSTAATQLFGMIFCGGCFAVSVVILTFTLPIYLFSSEPSRVERAGGLVKTCLKFIIGSGSGVLATLSFS